MDILRRPFQRIGKSPDENPWIKCARCHELNYIREFERNLKVCARCGYHGRLTARERIAMLVDEGSFVEMAAGLAPGDPLRFVSEGKRYTDKIKEEQAKTGLFEAVVSGLAQVERFDVVIAALDFSFLGASMGSVVGEKVTRAIEEAERRGVPLVAISASGGARMHEGIISLMQMAKTSTALARLAAARVPFISILTDPTTGGVTASFASLGDILIAEPGALIGFAGPRVIEQITRQKLPPGFQTAEFLLEHGMIDMVVHRRELKDVLARLLTLYCSGVQVPELVRYR